MLDGDKSEVRRVGIGTLGANSLPFVPTDANLVSIPRGPMVTAAIMASEPRNVIHFSTVP